MELAGGGRQRRRIRNGQAIEPGPDLRRAAIRGVVADGAQRAAEESVALRRVGPEHDLQAADGQPVIAGRRDQRPESLDGLEVVVARLGDAVFDAEPSERSENHPAPPSPTATYGYMSLMPPPAMPRFSFMLPHIKKIAAKMGANKKDWVNIPHSAR